MKTNNSSYRISKHIFYLLLALVFVGGCSTNTPTETNKQPTEKMKNYTITKTERSTVNFGLHTIEYEGCEYIIYKDNSIGSVQMIHKHNCKYCAERALAN